MRRNDTPDSEEIRDPRRPDHASGAVGDINLFRSRLLQITGYGATIEDDGSAHSDVTVLGLGGDRIGGDRFGADRFGADRIGGDRFGDNGLIGSSASSRGRNREGENGDALKTCRLLGDVLCVSLLYHNVVATEDGNSSLAAARGGLLALCLGGRERYATTSYECNGSLSLGVAEGLGVAKRDKQYGDTKAHSANELLNLCLGQRDRMTGPCGDGLGLQALHSDSRSTSDKPDTERHSFLLGIDGNGRSSYLVDQPDDRSSYLLGQRNDDQRNDDQRNDDQRNDDPRNHDGSYLLDQPVAIPIPQDCGNSAVLCLFLNQGRSIIFHNPKGAGSAQEALRLNVLNRTLLVVLGQAETLVHESEGCEQGKPCEHGRPQEGGPGGRPGERGHENEGPGNNNKRENNGGPELASTGTDLAPMLAGGFLLTGLGALTVAATRRRTGKHSL